MSLPSFVTVPPYRLVRCASLTCIVDGFKYANSSIKTYFLSHFHSDHYNGITSTWNSGVIHCSAITGVLLQHSLGVQPQYIASHPLDTPFLLQPDVEITLLTANHCPGSVIIRFCPIVNENYSSTLSQSTSTNKSFRGRGRSNAVRQIPAEESRRSAAERALLEYAAEHKNYGCPAMSGPGTVLHTGDFRFHESMKSHPLLATFRPDSIYLDTTYCHPKFLFPRQIDATVYVVKCIIDHIKEPNTRKEKILRAIASSLHTRVFLHPKKARLLTLMNTGDMHLYTTDPHKSRFHVVGWNTLGESWPYFRPNYRNCDVYLDKLNDGLMAREIDVEEAELNALTLEREQIHNIIVDKAMKDESIVCGDDMSQLDALNELLTPDVHAAVNQIPPRYDRVIGVIPTGWVFHKTKTFPPPYFRRDRAGVKGEVREEKLKENEAEEDPMISDDVTAKKEAAAVFEEEEETIDSTVLERNNSDPQISTSSPAPALSPSPSSSLLPPPSPAMHVFYLVPYSEHSNFSELQSCVNFFKPREIVPTVFQDQNHVRKILSYFRNSVDRTAAIRAFIKQSFNANSIKSPLNIEPTSDDNSSPSPSPFPLSSSSSSLLAATPSPPTRQNSASLISVETPRPPAREEVDLVVEEATDEKTTKRTEGNVDVSNDTNYVCHACSHTFQSSSSLISAHSLVCTKCQSSFIEEVSLKSTGSQSIEDNKIVRPSTDGASNKRKVSTNNNFTPSPRRLKSKSGSNTDGGKNQKSLSSYFSPSRTVSVKLQQTSFID